MKELKKIDALSVGKNFAIAYFILAFIIGLAMAIPFFLFPNEEVKVSAYLLMFLGMVIFYPILGFVCGAISALIYNLIAKYCGGIKFELKDVHHKSEEAK